MLFVAIFGIETLRYKTKALACRRQPDSTCWRAAPSHIADHNGTEIPCRSTNILRCVDTVLAVTNGSPANLLPKKKRKTLGMRFQGFTSETHAKGFSFLTAFKQAVPSWRLLLQH